MQAVRRSLLEMILEPYLGNDTSLYQWRSMAFLQKILTDRPAKWLPQWYKNYEELLVGGCGSGGCESWRSKRRVSGQRIGAWKQFNSLQMLHPMGQDRSFEIAFQYAG